MAKREFITKEQIKKKFPIMENDFGMVVNERLHKALDELPTITEQDIVKPYLDKLKKQAKKNSVRWYVGRVDGKSDDVVLLEDLECLVDNLLSEQGDTDG